MKNNMHIDDDLVAAANAIAAETGRRMSEAAFSSGQLTLQSAQSTKQKRPMYTYCAQATFDHRERALYGYFEAVEKAAEAWASTATDD